MTFRSLASVLVGTCLTALPAGAFDTVYNYQRMGTSAAVAIGSCGVSTSSPFGGGNDLTYSPAGLGHLGGDSDSFIDSGETVAITSSLGARPGAAYRVASAGNEDADAFSGESLLEAFSGAVSLGVLPVSGVGWIEVADLFGGAAITRFEVTALESIRLGAARWKLPPGAATEAAVGLAVFSPDYTVASPMLQCGVRIETADGDLHVGGSLDSLGIVGGGSDRVDAGESLLVTFGEPIPQLGYRLTDATNVAGTFESGDHFVEAFGEGGTSLGLRSAAGDDEDIDLTALYGGVPIEAFELIGVGDAFRLRYVVVTPEPQTGLGVAALGAILWIARRRRAHATPSTSP